MTTTPMSDMTTTPMSDEDTLRNHLCELRGNVSLYRITAAKTSNLDSKNMFKDIANSNLEIAQALHRLLEKSGVKGLGPTEGV